MAKKRVECVDVPEPCFKEEHRESAAKRRVQEKEAVETTTPKTPIVIEEHRIDLQANTVRFIAFFIFAVISFLICLFVIAQVMQSYLLYEKKSRFPGPFVLFIGTFLSTVVIAYICYIITVYNPKRAIPIFWIFILFNIFYMVWFLNLSLRADSFAKGVFYGGRGSFYMFLTFLMSLFILYFAWEYSISLGILALLAVVWITFLLFIWIFDGTIYHSPMI
jgi:hypothetical protein